jgi:polyphosphate kinase
MIEERLAPPIEAPPPDLRSSALYINRELAWLDFNRRVLHEALDPRCSSG